MQKPLLLLLCSSVIACKENISFSSQGQHALPLPAIQQKLVSDKNSWAYFLQHLPKKDGPVVDYRGHQVDNQQKKFTLINYDVGPHDLQQCADALMRLRAEYLFSQGRYHDIRFHFTSGHLYTFTDHCNGKKPLPSGNGVRFLQVQRDGYTFSHQSLRRYLDLVYSYAGTISLANELQTADSFGIGTVIISPGSPGHCLIIADEATTPSGEKLYQLVEGYSPAQSIYVLRNVTEPGLGYWHRLQNGIIQTASYTFRKYRLKKFE